MEELSKELRVTNLKIRIRNIRNILRLWPHSNYYRRLLRLNQEKLEELIGPQPKEDKVKKSIKPYRRKQ